MKIADVITFDINTGVLTIDGEPLGIFVAEHNVVVTAAPHERTSTIRLSLIAHSAEIIGNPELSEDEETDAVAAAETHEPAQVPHNLGLSRPRAPRATTTTFDDDEPAEG